MSILSDDVPCVLVETKCDLGDLSSQSLKSMAELHMCRGSFKTSAKTGHGVEQLFDTLAKMMIEHNKETEAAMSLNFIDLERSKKTKGCFGNLKMC